MDQTQFQAIVGFIWGIADDCLRDVYVRGKYRDVILPMTVIRRLDAVLEKSKWEVLAMKARLDAEKVTNQTPALCQVAGQSFCNSSPFLLKDLTARSKPQQLKADFIAYLNGFSPNVQEILDKFKFRNQIDTMTDAGILGAVIEKFVTPTVNLSPEPVLDDQGNVRLPGLDNHTMGTIFEELIRRFNEENNEEAGEHFTPRDVIELMADLVFLPIADRIKDTTYTCYDGASGTGGMLTVAQKHLNDLAEKNGKTVSIHLFGQEINPETYAITKSDMLLSGEGEEAEHIEYGSTLSDDRFPEYRFDFMLSNPPYGKSWKTDADKLGGKSGIIDPRFVVSFAGDGEFSMIPRSSDGQLLFLLNNIAKMKQDTELGSRIAEVHNGSSLFSGDAGSGESNARRYMIENDLVEAIIALPENMFYNTGIGTYIWILSNRKAPERRGKIQLIDATAMKSPRRKSMGKKNCEFTEDIRNEIVRVFMEMETNEVSRIFPNEEFGYWKVEVERPLRQKVIVNLKTIENTISTFRRLGVDIDNTYENDGIPIVKPQDFFSFMENNPDVDVIKLPKSQGSIEFEKVFHMYMKALIDLMRDDPYMDYNAFVNAVYQNPHIKGKTRFRQFEELMFKLTEKDQNAEIVRDKFGDPVADPDLRDTENIPFTYEGGLDAFMKNKILPYVPDAYINEKQIKIGYEINFTKYFYKPPRLRPLGEITADLRKLETETAGLLEEILGGER